MTPGTLLRARSGATAGAVALASFAALLTAPAANAATCSYSAAAGTATVNTGAVYDEVDVARTAAGGITVDGVACGAATVSNINTLNVTGGTNSQYVTIDLANGPLGPGKTAEATGVSDIEVDVNLGGGYDQLRLAGSAASDTFRVGALGATLNTDTDNDITYSGVEEFELAGRGGGDILSAGGSAPTGDPLSRDVTLLGGAGGDQLTGGRGHDSLQGDLDESFGDPTVAGNDVLMGGDGSDDLAGHSGNDDLRGESGSDQLELDLGVDKYSGGSGSDYFEANFEVGHMADGADAIAGGSGTDSLWLDDRTGPLVITLDGVANDGADTSAPANGTAEEGDNIGADVENVNGGEGNDIISADTPAANALEATNDLSGNSGNDTLRGGAGNDDLYSASGADKLYGGADDDQLDGDADDDQLFGGDDNDHLTGGTGADKSYGENGDDQFWEEGTADGADTISGGAGVDAASFSSRSTNTLITLDNAANDGADVNQDKVAEEKDNVKADIEDVSTGSGNDVINADTTAANAAGTNNNFSGGNNNDVLKGGAGDDRLEGDYGDDEITGGLGSDYLDGYEGADKFYALDKYFDELNGGGGTDTAVSADAYDLKTQIP